MQPIENPARVLLVDTISGSNYFAVELVRALAPLVRLTVFTTLNSALKREDGVRLVLGFPEYGGSRAHLSKLLTQIRGTTTLACELWRHRKATVHIQFFRAMVLELPVYALFHMLGGRIVFTAHNVLPHELRWWHKALYRMWFMLVDQVHVMSAHTARELANAMHVPSARIHVVPHGNYASFRRMYPTSGTREVRRRLGVNENTVLLLFFGLIREYKGVDLLLRAFAHVERDADVCLVIAGGASPALAQRTQTLIDELGIGERVRYLPKYLPDDELSRLLEASDVAVLPYRHIYQSGALMLAMTYGKAIVASDIEGFREYVEPGKSAVLVDPSDAQQFAATLTALVRDPTQRRLLGQAALERSLHDYDWRGIAKDIVSMYEVAR